MLKRGGGVLNLQNAGKYRNLIPGDAESLGYQNMVRISFLGSLGTTQPSLAFHSSIRTHIHIHTHTHTQTNTHIHIIKECEKYIFNMLYIMTCQKQKWFYYYKPYTCLKIPSPCGTHQPIQTPEL